MRNARCYTLPPRADYYGDKTLDVDGPEACRAVAGDDDAAARPAVLARQTGLTDLRSVRVRVPDDSINTDRIDIDRKEISK